MRQYLASMLTERYRVLTASDAERGIDIARESAPDVVLLDLMLPGMDGLEACSHLRAPGMPPDSKILMLTAKIDEGTKVSALRMGADDFLTKPFSSVEVQTRVAKLLETSQLQSDLRTKNRELTATLSQLHLTEAQLVQSEKLNALGKLAAGLLHEINNPLNYALLAVQVAEKAATDSTELRDNLRDIRGGLKRVSDIISDLRAFAYPDQGRHKKPFYLQDAIAVAARFTAHQLKDVKLTLPERDLPAVFGSHTQISQVLVNLLSNAADAVAEVNQQRTPRIEVEAEEENQSVVVRVRDNGTGVEQDVLPKIFDPFFTTKPEGKGIGLGLSVCHTIIGQHGSELRAQSVLGHGTVFSFALPLAGP
jgi:C4-dicarboxylate-specific signal transduction histidine kinase